MTQTQVVILGYFLGAILVLFPIVMLLRDILTRSYYQKKSKDHIVAEFLSKVGLAFTELVKIDDQKTGAFTYKGRQYFAGEEKVTIAYPPGRSSAAQVNMHKCYPNASSSDMATNLTGKPTVDAVIVFAIANQGDTKVAMERSWSESGGGANPNKHLLWVYILVGVGVLVGIAGLVFTIKGQGINGDIVAVLNKIATALGVK